MTITDVGWRIGAPWRQRYAGQDVSRAKDDFPLRLEHGQHGNFATELFRGAWLGFFSDFVQDAPLRTLRGYVETSLGQMVVVTVGAEVIERVQGVRNARAAGKALAS